MKTQRYSTYLWALLLALATFSVACGSNAEEETTDPSDSVMYTAPDAEDANYDNEVTVDQATPFSEETAVAAEESAAGRDFGTQPGDGETEKKELEYFSNEYKKAYSPSSTDQRAVAPSDKRSPEEGNIPPYGLETEGTAAPAAEEKTAASAETDPAASEPTESTESTERATSTASPAEPTAPETDGESTKEESTAPAPSASEPTVDQQAKPTRTDWSRDDNPTDYVKPEPISTPEPEPMTEPETDDAMTTSDWREQAADRYLEESEGKDAMAETAPIVYDPTIYTLVIWNTEAVSDEWPYGEPAYRNLSELDAPPLFENECMNELGYKARMECSHDALQTYFYEESNYPEEAREEKNEARAFVTFVLDEQGEVVPASAELTGYDGECTACKDEALRLVREMPQWETPAQLNGRTVASQITVPIRFIVRLND